MIDFGGIAILLLCIENETSPKCAGLNTLTGEKVGITGSQKIILETELVKFQR